MKRNTPRHAIEESIDETIAQLNETIEEIRSLDVRTETLTEIIPADIPPPPKMKKPLVGLHHSKSASRLPENRFIVGEIRPSLRPEETRTYLQSKATHHSSRRMTFRKPRRNRLLFLSVSGTDELKSSFLRQLQERKLFLKSKHFRLLQNGCC